MKNQLIFDCLLGLVVIAGCACFASQLYALHALGFAAGLR